MFLKCATNSCANTGFENFLEAIQRFHCLARVHTDYGTEIIEAAKWMLQHHRTENRPFITGLSVITRESIGYGLMLKSTLFVISRIFLYILSLVRYLIQMVEVRGAHR